MALPHRAPAAAIAWQESAMTRETGWMAAGMLRALGAALFAITAGAAWGGNTVVYRCLDSHLGVVYTDLPCKDGEAFDTRSGEADPAALARLERIRDALDRGTALRLADGRDGAYQREVVAARLPSDTEEHSGDDASAYGSYGYGVGGYFPARPHPPHQRPPRPPVHAGAAPNPPYVVPRP
jgi:hypothetical protein